MPIFSKVKPKYTPAKEVEVKWETWDGGLNTLFKPTELKSNEIAQADNLMLIGKGTPTGRWGSQIYNQAGTGSVRMLSAYYNSLTGANFLLSITDMGYMTYANNASYTIIPGASFASGLSYQSAQLANNLYISSATLPFVRFDGTNLIPYLPLSSPTNVSVAQLSAASGFTTYSWIVTALSQTGETLSSVAKTLASMPLDLTLTSTKITWNAVSAASGVLEGYNIYRGFPGDETLLASVDPATTQFYDVGDPSSDVIFPPTSDSTGGIRAKYILKFDDRLVLAGIAGTPSRVYISGRFPYHDKFTAIDGGGYIEVAPNDGDDITGLGIAGNQGMSSGGTAPPASSILVFKNYSVHRVVLSTTELGNFTILDPQAQVLTSSNGCSSADTIVAVENDSDYLGRKGFYGAGQEPDYLNQIRTNEISARIRPYIRALSDADFRGAAAGYIDNKVLLSFPVRKETMIYDRERLAFMGPWATPFGITKWLKYYDSSGQERWIAGATNGFNYEFAPSLVTDSGTAISRIFRSKKEPIGDWSVFKVLKLLYVLFRNVRGTVMVNLRIEDRTGNTVTTKTFNVSSDLGSGGWGNDEYGDQQFGQTDATITLTGDELVRWAQIYKSCRVVQLEVMSTAANANWEFLSSRMIAQPLGDQSLPASTRV